MEKQVKGKKSKRGRPKGPKVRLELEDLSNLKKKIKEIRKRKVGLYRRWGKV